MHFLNYSNITYYNLCSSRSNIKFTEILAYIFYPILGQLLVLSVFNLKAFLLI